MDNANTITDMAKVRWFLKNIFTAIATLIHSFRGSTLVSTLGMQEIDLEVEDLYETLLWYVVPLRKQSKYPLVARLLN